MSTAEALKAARTVGIRIEIDGDDLVLEASAAPPPGVLDLLSRHKAGIVTLLRPADDSWSAEDWQVFFDERAGIAEFDGGLSRGHAEAHAFACCAVEWLNRNPMRSPPGCCLGCGCGDQAHLLVELATTFVLAPERADRPGTTSFAFLKNSSSASGISEVSMSSSAIAAISASRFFEIGIEVFPFIPGRFARADDPCGPIPIRMDNAGYHYPTYETVAPLSHFALVPFVFK
jgi:hypothetical protein